MAKFVQSDDTLRKQLQSLLKSGDIDHLILACDLIKTIIDRLDKKTGVQQEKIDTATLKVELSITLDIVKKQGYTQAYQIIQGIIKSLDKLGGDIGPKGVLSHKIIKGSKI